MREKQFNLRLTEEEWGILVRRAEERGMTPSSYARRKLFHILEPQVAPEGGFVEVASEIASKEEEAPPVEPMKEEKKFKPRLCSRCRNVGSHQKQCTIPGCGGS